MIEAPALLISTYRVSAGGMKAFRSLALRLATTAKAHKACDFLDIAQGRSDPATFRLIEGWRDEAALDAHGASNELKPC